jgi:hypothetical protein
MDHDGGGAGQAPARPVVYAVARARAGGRFTYTTPLWPDARGYLVGLLEAHAAAAGDVARLARAAALQVPAGPPVGGWSVQVGACRYELERRDVGPAPGVPLGECKSVKPPTPVLTADLNGVLTAPAQRRCESAVPVLSANRGSVRADANVGQVNGDVGTQ